MILKVGLVLGLALCALSDRRSAISEQRFDVYPGHHGYLSHIGDHEPGHHDVYAWAYPSYEFSYNVDDPHTHDKKGQHEIRDGDKVTGSYWLVQPDGRLRTVKYSSTHKSGFHADVHYQPPHGHHPVREHHGHNHHHHSEHNIRRMDENRGDHGDRHHDLRGYIDEQQQHIERHHGHRDNRIHDNRGDHNDNRDHNDSLWGWLKLRREHKDREVRIDDIGSRGYGHGHEEHWRHGVLVGWTEGRDKDGRDRGREDHGSRDHHYRGRDDHNRGQNDYHTGRDDHYRGHGDHNRVRDDHHREREDRHRDRDNHRHETKQENYHQKNPNIKPIIPYGQRLN